MRTGIVILLCAGCASARNAAGDRSAVIAVYDEYNSVFVSRDFGLLERLALRDLIHVTASGHLNTLDDLEKGLSGDAVRIDNFATDNHEVRFFGDAAVVVGR